MKKREEILIMVIIFLLIVLLLPTITKAGVESKPGTTAWTNISVSNAYDVCYGMASGGSTLGNCSLDPHLALNKDWGAAAYLAISGYGAVTTKTGPAVTIGEKSDYTSTTGNITGIINLGKTGYCFTASSIAVGLEEESSNNQYRTSLIKNKDTRYVETLPDPGEEDATNTKGMAMVETQRWFGFYYGYKTTAEYPLAARTGVLGICANYGMEYNAYCDRKVLSYNNFPSSNLECSTLMHQVLLIF